MKTALAISLILNVFQIGITSGAIRKRNESMSIALDAQRIAMESQKLAEEAQSMTREALSQAEIFKAALLIGGAK